MNNSVWNYYLENVFFVGLQGLKSKYLTVMWPIFKLSWVGQFNYT